MYNVLYVDDDPHLLEIAQYFLEEQGDFAVTTAILATNALSLPGFSSFDAIVSDYEMPGMNGIAFLKKVREKYGDIPFVLFTGRGREDVVIEAINNGADSYFQKGGQPESQFAELVHGIKKAVERRRAALALQESERTLRINEKRLAMAQVIGHTGSWEYDLKTNLIWGSAEGLHIFGYPPVAGNHPVADIEACIPERERIHQALVDLIAEGREYSLEYTIHPADGSASKVIQSFAQLERDAGGNPLKVLGVIQDITERKRTEEEITFKNVILSTQQETSLDAILIVDENGNILHYNQKFIEIWGIPGDMLTSKIDEPVLQYVVEQLVDPEAFLSRVRYLYDHRDEKSFEELLLKDGRTLERFSASMLAGNGKYYGRVWYFRDITGRKRVEEDLHRQLVFTQQLIDTIPSPIFVKDSNSIYRGVNSAFEQFIGLPKEQILGKTMYAIAPKNLADLYYEQDQALLAQPGTQVYESKVRFADGSLRDVIFNKATFIDESGGNISLVGIIVDITERKKMEDALRESEARFRQIFETLPIGLWIADKNGTLQMGNPAGQKIWEAQPRVGQEDYGIFKAWRMPLRELILPDEWALGYAVNEGRVTEQELLEIEAFDGSHKYILNWAAPVKNDAGEITGAFVLNQDITERKHAEEENWNSGEILKGILNSIEVRVFWKDRNLTYLGCNVPFARDAGFEKPDDIIGRDDYAMGWRDQADLYRSDDRAVIESGIPKIFIEEPQKTPSGEIMSLLTSKIPLRDAEGKIIGVLGTYIDITGRKRAEEALVVANKKLTLLSGITRHDITNQLTALRGYRKMLEKKIPDQKFTDLFQKIDDSAQQISAMIQFTKEYESIGVNAPVWQSPALLADRAAKQASLGTVTVKNYLPVGFEVFADPLIARVFYNLIDNTVMHGGKITTIGFSLQEQNGNQIIVCEDDGDGVPAGEKEQLFDRGFGKHTGLGLYLAREILSITGISIRENGEPGKGARFEIIVPERNYRTISNSP
jgi:PAS domain S-box-containing protein